MPRQGIIDSIFTGVRERYEQNMLQALKNEPLPRHVAVIMDGNRRFAKELRLSINEGHALGKKKLEEFLDWCFDIGIKIVTVYAFSTENFSRDFEEIDFLMKLYADSLQNIAKDERVIKNRIRIKVIGRIDLLPEYVKHAAEIAENSTKDFDGYLLNIAIAYGGREEILDAIRNIAKEVKSGIIEPEMINDDTMNKHLYTREIEDPDLVIRTSGEERISNFLLWQSAYSELYFMDVYWPEMTRLDLIKAIRDYQRRNRRFGK